MGPTSQIKTFLRLGLQTDETVLPNWAIEHIRAVDELFSDALRKELLIEGFIILTKDSQKSFPHSALFPRGIHISIASAARNRRSQALVAVVEAAFFHETRRAGKA